MISEVKTINDFGDLQPHFIVWSGDGWKRRSSSPQAAQMTHVVISDDNIFPFFYWYAFEHLHQPTYDNDEHL